MTEIAFVCTGFGEDHTAFQEIIREAINESSQEWVEIFEEFDMDMTRVSSKDLFCGLSVIAGLLNDPDFEGVVTVSIDEVTGAFEIAEAYSAPIEFTRERL